MNKLQQLNCASDEIGKGITQEQWAQAGPGSEELLLDVVNWPMTRPDKSTMHRTGVQTSRGAVDAGRSGVVVLQLGDQTVSLVITPYGLAEDDGDGQITFHHTDSLSEQRGEPRRVQEARTAVAGFSQAPTEHSDASSTDTRQQGIVVADAAGVSSVFGGVDSTGRAARGAAARHLHHNPIVADDLFDRTSFRSESELQRGLPSPEALRSHGAHALGAVELARIGEQFRAVFAAATPVGGSSTVAKPESLLPRFRVSRIRPPSRRRP